MRGDFRHILILVAGLAPGLMFDGAAAALAADAGHGGDLARRWCAACHIVDAEQKQASADVPPFATVANSKDFSAEKTASFLLEPHPKMPNYPLSPDEAADIAAYIASLRK
jgi:mono/diheme cytochrome c family protein